MSEIKRVTEQLLEEILKDCDSVLWKLARTTNIPGYDADDLMQEMRIKIWETISDDQYDPERVKPTSFYYRVCKRHLINLNASKIWNYYRTEAKDREYRDPLDQKKTVSDVNAPQLDHFPTNFVQGFTESFKKDFF